MENGMEGFGKNPLWGLEEKLAIALKPVSPDPAFVNALKLKLTRTPMVILESGRKKVGLLAIGLGLLAGTLAIWIFRKFRH